MLGGCWHGSVLPCQFAAAPPPAKYPAEVRNGSPVVVTRPSSRYVYSSWTPCLRTPLATGSCGIAKQGATAATCGTPSLVSASSSTSARRSRAPAGTAGVPSTLWQMPHRCAGGVRLGVHSSSKLGVATRARAAGSAARQARRTLQQQAQESLRERGQQGARRVRLGVHCSNRLKVAARAGAAGSAPRQARRSQQQQAQSCCESGGSRERVARTRFFSVWLLFSALPSSASCRCASFCSAAHTR